MAEQSDPARVAIPVDEAYKASIECLAATWPSLPPHIRKAILMLVDVGAG